MTRGSEFGRRSGRAPEIIGVPSRRSAAARAAEATDTDKAPADPVRIAVFFFAATVAVLVACMVGVWFAAPDVVATAATEGGRSTAVSETGPAETPVEPDTASAPQPAEAGEEKSEQGRAQSLRKVGAVSEQQRTAALTFFGFYHLNTRVRSAYCAALGVD